MKDLDEDGGYVLCNFEFGLDVPQEDDHPYVSYFTAQLHTNDLMCYLVHLLEYLRINNWK